MAPPLSRPAGLGFFMLLSPALCRRVGVHWLGHLGVLPHGSFARSVQTEPSEGDASGTKSEGCGPRTAVAPVLLSQVPRP